MQEGTKSADAVGPRHIIARPRLTRVLDDSNARIILFVAPAGYGKTILARQWLAARDHVWYQATEASADAAGFAQGLERVLFRSADGASSVRALIRSNPALSDDPVELANILAERLADWPQERWIALDDYHLVGRSEAAEALAGELVALTAVRLLVTSRSRPGWVAARQLLYGEVAELGSAELSMTDAEAREVFGGSREIPLPDVLRGWPALLGLAAATPGAESIAGDAPLVYEFFAEELLREIDPALEAGLLRAAVAPILTPELLASQSEGTLQDAIERGFLRREGRSFSMHPLFQGFLRGKLRERDDQAEISRELATRLIELGRWDEAFDVIDTFGHADLIEQLLTEGAVPTLEDGRVETVTRWLRACRRMTAGGPVADFVHAALTARRGDHQKASPAAAEAATRLGEGHPLYAKALITAASSAYLVGRPVESMRCYRAAGAAAATENDLREAHFGLLTTAIEWESGDELDVLDRLRQAGGKDDESILRTVTAELLFAAHRGPIAPAIQRAKAVEHLRERASNRRIGSSFLHLFALALGLAAEYNAARAAARLALADVVEARLRFAVPLIRIRLAVAEMGLRNYSEARTLVDLIESDSRPTDDWLKAQTQLLRARLAISNKAPGEAVALLSYRIPDTLSPQTRGELLACKALAHACAGDVTTADELAKTARQVTCTLEAIGYAASADAVSAASAGRDGEVDRMLENCAVSGNLDSSMCAVRCSDALCRELECRTESGDPLGAVAARLVHVAELEDLEDEIEASNPAGLTPREQEVLRRLQEGLSNKEIADRLFISEVTVKAHLRHIYEKVGVKTRTQAVLWAQASDPSGNV